MGAGSRNSMVLIQRAGGERDAAGQPIDSWKPVAQVWANIRNRTGAQAMRADKPVSTVQSSVRIRRRADVAAGMRVYHGSTIYEIRAVLPDEESRERVDLVCEVISG